MSKEAIAIRPNEVKYVKTGGEVSAYFKKEKPRKNPSRTAYHEAKHSVFGKVERVTIIPGPGYLGLTKLSRFDPVAAAAPDADGEDGGEHDLFLISAMGYNLSAVRSAALSELNKKRDEVENIASLLEEKRSLSGFEVDHAIKETGRKKKIDEVVIFVKSPDGVENKYEIDIPKNSSVMVPGEWVDFSLN